MDDTPTIGVARNFLTLLRQGEPPSELALIKILDELALAYHQTPYCKPSENDTDAPRSDFQKRYAALGERFPGLGYYAVAHPTEPVTDVPMVGDAIV